MVVSPAQVERLSYKDVLRLAVTHQLLSDEACKRWFLYRDNRNSIAHDYGAGFANETMLLLPMFIDDARLLVQSLNSESDATTL